MTQGTLVITPITPLVNLNTLIDAQVAAKPFDDPTLKHEVHVGIVDEIKINKWGTWARFQCDALVARKWIKIEKVIGFVHSEESQNAAA